jgi:hypothetical protein
VPFSFAIDGIRDSFLVVAIVVHKKEKPVKKAKISDTTLTIVHFWAYWAHLLNKDLHSRRFTARPIGLL